MSNFTAKRRYAGYRMYEMPNVKLAKLYADFYGYEVRGGGWIYDIEGERVVRGWQAFADQLVERGWIVPRVGFGHRFAVGDWLIVNNPSGGQYTLTVTRVGRNGICALYYFTDERGREGSVIDTPCLASAA